MATEVKAEKILPIGNTHNSQALEKISSADQVW